MGMFSPFFSCGAKYGDNIYASARKFNGLVKIQINNGETEYVSKFPSEEEIIENQHSRAYAYRNEIFFFPAFGKYIHIYNLDTGNMTKYVLDRQLYKGEYCALLNDEIVVMIPKKIGGNILKFDLNKRESSVLLFWETLGDYFPKTAIYTFLRMVILRNKLYLPIYDSSSIICLDLNSLEIEVKRVKVDRLLGAVGGTEDIFLLTNDSSAVFKWNPEDNSVIPYNVAAAFGPNNCFTFGVQMNRKMFFFPSHSSALLGVELNNKIDVLLELEDANRKLMFLEPFCEENGIWALPYECDYMLCISEDNVKMKKISKIEVDSLSKEQFLESKVKTEGILSEDSDIQLVDYIGWIAR